MNLFHSLQQMLWAGGWLMIALTMTTFAIWFVYFKTLTCKQEEEVRRNTKFLAALVAAAPLIGLLGTVLGMMDTFQAVAMQNAQSTPQIARGISKALVTTQAGLVAAIPGTFALAHLKAKLRKLNKA